MRSWNCIGIVVLGLASGLLTGCDDGGPPRKTSRAASNKDRVTPVREALARVRAGSLSTPGANPSTAQRIDEVLDALDHQGPEAFRERVVLYYANVKKLEGVSGADLCMLGFVGGERRLVRFEILDREGRVIADCAAPPFTWEHPDPSHPLGNSGSSFYVAPSVFDTGKEDLSDEVKSMLIRLPYRWDESDLRVRIVFEGGVLSNALPLWKGVSRKAGP